MTNYKIGIFDSGIGGLTILKEINKIISNENILYYADSNNNPYGNKSDEELLKITTNIVKYLKNKNCKIIVIACNTATTRCIKNLREKFPELIFIGTEPAIKMACDLKYKNTLVLATTATIRSKSIKNLISKYKNNDQQIYLQACEGLAHAIETNNEYKIDNLLKLYLTNYQDKNIDSIILGCTHYPYIKEKILKFFPNAKIFDSSKGVANETKKQLLSHNLQSNSKILGKTKIIKSSINRF